MRIRSCIGKGHRLAFSGYAILLTGLFSIQISPAAESAQLDWAEARSLSAAAGNTVITSERLSFDQGDRRAIFEGHVVVTDPQVNIAADMITVAFSEDNLVIFIEAEGNVVIQQEDTIASGARARYEVAASKFVLSGDPWVRNGRDELAAETITFWRGTKRILCEPKAKLVIRSEQNIFHEAILKE